MQIKIGDKVRIKTAEQMKQEGHCWYLYNCLGSVATIRAVFNKDTFSVVGQTHFSLHTSMIEEVVTKAADVDCKTVTDILKRKMLRGFDDKCTEHNEGLWSGIRAVEQYFMDGCIPTKQYAFES